MRIHSVLIMFYSIGMFCFLAAHGSAVLGQSASERQSIEGEKKVAGRTMEEWKADLSSTNEIMRLRAVKSLGPFGIDAATLLHDCLSDESDAVKYWAADHLGSIGTEIAKSKIRERVIQSLQAVIQSSPEKAVSMAAAYALVNIDGSKEYLDLIIKRLSHGERGMACSAAEFLGKIGPSAKSALPELQLKYEKHTDYHVRGASLNAIRKIKGEPVR